MKTTVKKLLSILLGMAFLACSLSLPAAAQENTEELYEGQRILDLSFDDGSVEEFLSYVNGGDCEVLNQDGQLAIHIHKTGSLDYANQAYRDGFSIVEGVKYQLSFDAWSDAACSLEYRIQLNGGDYHAYVSDIAVMSPEPTHFVKEFVMEETSDPAPRLAFNMGMQPDMTEDPGEHTIYFDNICLEVVDASNAVMQEAEHAHSLLSVNHVGYRPSDQKVVVTDGSLAGAPFDVINEAGESCFQGTFGDAQYDSATNHTVCRGFFTGLQEEGWYRISVWKEEENILSEPFAIKEDVYADLTDAVFHMLTLQRCGTELTEAEAGIYAHPVCHMEPAIVYGTQERKDVSGGWHDAGDYGRYVVPGAQTVADLLFIYENIRADDAILAEARYELEWMLKMQDGESGGVYHKVTGANFPGAVMPQGEIDPLILAPISFAATGDFAAVMAKAAEDYETSDPAFAAACGAASEAAWAYLAAQPEWIGFTNPSDISTGEYPDTELQDEIFWAAVEILDQIEKGRMDPALHEEVWQVIADSMESGMSLGLGWADIGGLALYDLARMESDSASEDLKLQELAALSKEQILGAADELQNKISRDGYYASMGRNYYWGSNMGVANNGVLLLMARDLTGSKAYEMGAKRQLDYLLGVNGLDFCYVSGFGEKCLSDPHHRPSQAMGQAVPGMLAGGPNPNLEDPYAQQVLSGKAPALCYVDNQQSYSTNEVAIYWNSPLLVLLYGLQ